MPRKSSINLDELMGLPDFLSATLVNLEFHEKEGKWYENESNSPLSGIIEYKEKYKNGNVVFSSSFADGKFKESKYYYPTGEILCVEKWDDDVSMVSSEQFHYNGELAQIENYHEGRIISSKCFEENGKESSNYNYSKDDMRDISDTPNNFTCRILMKNWLEKGWEE
tara:strand:- start:17 stop:517 length:501 start_codon:yes stop_codon:yes gene_type:complete